MSHRRRTLWISLVFIGLFGPFAALFVLLRVYPPPPGAVDTAPAQRSDLSSNPLFDATAPANIQPGAGPLLAAGDGREVWVARPMSVGEHHVQAFQLLARANNSGAWSIVRPAGIPFFQGTPLALAAPLLHDAHSTGVFVFGQGGRVTAFTPDGRRDLDPLPAGHRFLAAAGSTRGIFALTAGVPVPPSTRPDDTLAPPAYLRLPEPPPPTTASTAPSAGATPAASAPASSAAAAATAPARPMLNALWFQGAGWMPLPPLGRLGDPQVPSPDDSVALVDVASTLCVLWVPKDDPTHVLIRTHADTTTDDPWSAPRRETLPQPLPHGAPFWALPLDETACAMYPIADGRTFALIAAPISLLDATPPPAAIPPMLLGVAGQNLASASHIAVAVSENSLVAVTVAADGSLRAAVFSRDGRPLSPPAVVTFSTPLRDIELGQNLALLVVALLVIMALWTWLKDPRTQRMPQGLRPGSLPARGVAWLIDLAIPFVIIVTALGLWDDAGYQNILNAWAASIVRPDELFSSFPLLYVLGAYTLHVSVGELFFRRSIGKAIMGLEVLMIDGKAPTVAAVLVRNFVRLVEMVPAGILIFFVFFSDYRQRLGDLLAHTIVVSHKAPGDDDTAETTEKSADVEEEETAGRR